MTFCTNGITPALPCSADKQVLNPYNGPLLASRIQSGLFLNLLSVLDSVLLHTGVGKAFVRCEEDKNSTRSPAQLYIFISYSMRYLR